MRWNGWLALCAGALLSLLPCFLLYRLCRRSRIWQAKRRGTTPDLAPLRAVFLAIGGILQFFYWSFVLLLINFKGMP